MKQLAGVIICCLTFSVSRAQVVVQVNRNGALFLGVGNKLEIAVENYKRGTLSVTTNNGEITGKHPDYYLIPAKLGEAALKIKWITVKGFKDSTIRYFRVEEFPAPIPYFIKTSLSGGMLPAPVARVQIAPGAYIYGGGDFGCGHVTIDSCTIIVIRDDKVFFSHCLHNPNGIRFSDDEETQKAIENLKGGDKLLFTGITCRGPGSELTRHLKAMEFTITDAEGLKDEVNKER